MREAGDHTDEQLPLLVLDRELAFREGPETAAFVEEQQRADSRASHETTAQIRPERELSADLGPSRSI